MNNKTILITGGAGFIGHHIIYKLLNETNSKIISLDRLDYSGSYNRINQVVQKNKNYSGINIFEHVPFTSRPV